MSRAARALLLVNAAFELAVAAVCLLAPRLLLGSVGGDALALTRVLAGNAAGLAALSLLAGVGGEAAAVRLALRGFVVFHAAVVAAQAVNLGHGGPVQPVIAHGLLWVAFVVAGVRDTQRRKS